MPIGWVRNVEADGSPSQYSNQQVALRGGDAALQRGVEQIALRVAPERGAARGWSSRPGRAPVASSGQAAASAGSVASKIGRTSRPLLVAAAVLLKNAPTVSPAHPFTLRSPGSMMPAMLIPAAKMYWSAVPRGQMPPPTVDEPGRADLAVGEELALHPVHREDVLGTGEEPEPRSGLRLRHRRRRGAAERHSHQGRSHQNALTTREKHPVLLREKHSYQLPAISYRSDR